MPFPEPETLLAATIGREHKEEANRGKIARL
jgi:hypothetical protein